jgi:hypothetical protein
VAWVWDSFDHLDVNRGPVLGEILNPGSRDPDSGVPNLPAVDWLHANALSWSPGDENLVLSLRHQDWVIKIDYENGAGDGHVIWRLGQGGDFTVNSTDPNPWFSHQHDAHLIDDHTMILFDNGNTRRASDPTADSRGQVWNLDVQTMTATLEFNVDMGSYSPMFGVAQRLSNGDYSFLSGAQGTAANQLGQAIEVRPDGSKAYVLAENKWEYRSFRTQTLYAGVSDQLAGDGGETSWAGDNSPGRSRGTRPSQGGPAGASLAATTGFSDGFGPAITAALTAPAGQPAVPATLRVASPIAATAAPAVLVGDTDAGPAFADPATVAGAAASDALFADGGNDPWLEAFGDDLARALSP